MEFFDKRAFDDRCRARASCAAPISIVGLFDFINQRIVNRFVRLIFTAYCLDSGKLKRCSRAFNCLLLSRTPLEIGRLEFFADILYSLALN